jgi:hypothetical protein
MTSEELNTGIRRICDRDERATKLKAEREFRRQETVLMLRSSVQRYRRKKNLRRCLEWTAIAVLALACGFALMGLVEGLQWR